MTDSREPEWQPLHDLAPEHLDDFMWMFEVELSGGHRFHAYKHYWTRRYIHLDHEGRSFAFVDPPDPEVDYGYYQETEPETHLDAVLCREEEGPPPYDIVRRNLWDGSIELSWARSATKHRISRRRSAYVIEDCDLFLEQWVGEGSPIPTGDPRLVFLGDDEKGIALEVVAVELEEHRLHVIHAMRLRAKYRERYGELKRWRR